MTNDKTIRLLRLTHSLDKHLRDEVPNDAARQFLLDEILTTPAGRAHVVGTGEPPSMQELADEVWATTGGTNLRHILDQRLAQKNADDTTDRERKLAEINAIENPCKRINAFRESGLA